MSRWECPTGLATAGALALGVALAGWLPRPEWMLLGGVSLLLAHLGPRLAPAVLRPATGVLTLVVGLATGGLLAAGGERPAVPDLADTWVAGRVAAWEEGGRRVLLDAVQAGGRRLSPRRRLRVLGRQDWGMVPRAGWLAVRGRLEADRGPTNPGMRRWGGLDGTLLADRHTRPSWGPGPPSRLIAARVRMARGLHERLPGFPGRLAEAMVLGRSRALTPEERDVFRRTGAAHLVAVSGLHVGLIAWLVNLCLSGLPRRGRILGTAAATWAYAALAGGAPSAVRAAALITAAGAGAWVHRPRPLWRWLALILPWCLWADPGLLESVGFRLSVGAVGGILFVADCVRPRGRLRILAPAMASLGAQWGTLPVLVNAFGALAPLALVPNLLAVPLAGVFLPAALLALATGSLGALGVWPAAAARALGSAIGAGLRLCAGPLPYLDHLGRVPTGALAAGPLLMMFWFSLPGRLRERPRVRAAALLLAVVSAAAVFLPVSKPPGPWIAFLDVGQGDAMVFRLSDGTTWVMDVGDDRGPGDAGRDVVAPFLRREGIRTVDGLLVSHRHRDHVGGLAAFLERVRVRRVYDAGYGPAGGTAGRMDSLLAAHHLWPCLVARGDTLHAGPGCRLVALHPGRGDPTLPTLGVGLNDRSLVLRLVDGDLAAVLAGDAEGGAEASMLKAGTLAPVRILKVGHHGSRTSSSAAFLDALDPEIAVISAGEHNRFGHPDPATLRHLAARGVRVFRTDRDGCVWIAPRGGGGLRIERHPPRPRTPGPGRGGARRRLPPG